MPGMAGRDPSLALVLSGGGARGAFEAGAIAALDDAGLRPGIIAGTSAGAITGAGVACGLTGEEIIEVWCSMETRDVMRLRRDVHTLIQPSVLARDPGLLLGAGRGSRDDSLLDVFGWSWVLHLEPLRERLVDVLDGEVLPLDDDVVLTLAATELATGDPVRFANRPLPEEQREEGTTIVTELTVDHVLASSAIPGLFQPIEIDGTAYWDGVIGSNTPVTGALEHEPDRVLVVGATAEEGPPRPPETLGDVIALAIAHVMRDALRTDVDNARTVNELVEAGSGSTHHRVVDLEQVLPETPINAIGDVLSFEPEIARDLAEEGRRITTAVLDRIDWQPR